MLIYSVQVIMMVRDVTITTSAVQTAHVMAWWVMRLTAKCKRHVVVRVRTRA